MTARCQVIRQLLSEGGLVFGTLAVVRLNVAVDQRLEPRDRNSQVGVLNRQERWASRTDGFSNLEHYLHKLIRTSFVIASVPLT